MSVENVKKFMELVLKDKDLQQELTKAGTDMPKIIALGAKKGLTFTPEDVKTVWEETGGELSEEQLEKVAGGFVTTTAALVASAVVSALAAVAVVGVEIATAAMKD